MYSMIPPVFSNIYGSPLYVCCSSLSRLYYPPAELLITSVAVPSTFLSFFPIPSTISEFQPPTSMYRLGIAPLQGSQASPSRCGQIELNLHRPILRPSVPPPLFISVSHTSTQSGQKTHFPTSQMPGPVNLTSKSHLESDHLLTPQLQEPTTCPLLGSAQPRCQSLPWKCRSDHS